MSIKLSALNWLLKTFERPALSKLEGPAAGQKRLLQQSKLFREVPGVTYSNTILSSDGIDVSTVVANPSTARPRAALLYLHGGAYSIGSPETHRKLAARIGQGCDLTTYVIDYRLAPEHKFPGAVEDAVAAYSALLERGYTHITIAGDSAGGGLSFALLNEMLSVSLNLSSNTWVMRLRMIRVYHRCSDSLRMRRRCSFRCLKKRCCSMIPYEWRTGCASLTWM